MKASTLFSTLAFGAVVAAAIVSPAVAATELHCNNKVCDSSSGPCVETTSGPHTHCIDAGTVCAWDRCDA